MATGIAMLPRSWSTSTLSMISPTFSSLSVGSGPGAFPNGCSQNKNKLIFSQNTNLQKHSLCFHKANLWKAEATKLIMFSFMRVSGSSLR